MNRPNFLILGAAKCGTTSLFHYLGQHPEVFLAQPKETTFFEAQYEKGLDWYWHRHYSGWDGESAAGEARVYNLFLPYVADRIRRSLPDARLLVILRHPVERAYSHWWHRTARAQERRPFEQAIRENLAELAAGRDFEGAAGEAAWRRGLYRNTNATRYSLYVELGHYDRQLARYYQRFAAERIKVLFFDDLRRDPQGVAEDAWKFLGLPDTHRVSDRSPQNAAAMSQWSRLELSLRHLNRFARPLTRLLPTSMKHRALAALPRKAAQRPPLEEEVAERLALEYRDDVRRLERRLGRDLEEWTRPPAISSTAA